MKLVFLALLIAFVLGDEQVVTLTANNFEEFIKTHDRVLVEFYAPWCGHCKSLAPEYEKAANTLKSKNSRTILAKVDATEEKSLGTKYGIKGFPTLKYFTKDTENPSDYTGGRTEQTIVSWLNKREVNALTPIDNIETYNEYITKDSVVLVGFYAQDSEEAKTIKEVADAIRENTLSLLVTNEQLAKELNANWNSLRLTVNVGGEKSEVNYEGGALEAKSILTWITGERFPLVGEIGPENYKDYVDRGLPIVWIAFNPEEEGNKDKVTEAVTDAARANKGKLSFVTLDGNKFAQHVTNLGIPSVPGLMLIDGNNKFKYNGDLNANDISKFFEQYNAGTLEKFLKTQPVPESNDENVFVLVGSEFENLIGKDKDVFVEYYAPWCGHCKKLVPEYEKLAEAFANVNDVVIAKIDATENDTPEEIKGFPTLVFYPKGKTAGVKYQGDRSAQAMIDWIKSKATVDISAVKTEL